MLGPVGETAIEPDGDLPAAARPLAVSVLRRGWRSQDRLQLSVMAGSHPARPVRVAFGYGSTLIARLDLTRTATVRRRFMQAGGRLDPAEFWLRAPDCGGAQDWAVHGVLVLHLRDRTKAEALAAGLTAPIGEGGMVFPCAEALAALGRAVLEPRP